MVRRSKTKRGCRRMRIVGEEIHIGAHYFFFSVEKTTTSETEAVIVFSVTFRQLIGARKCALWVKKTHSSNYYNYHLDPQYCTIPQISAFCASMRHHILGKFYWQFSQKGHLTWRKSRNFCSKLDLEIFLTFDICTKFKDYPSKKLRFQLIKEVNTEQQIHKENLYLIIILFSQSLM